MSTKRELLLNLVGDTVILYYTFENGTYRIDLNLERTSGEHVTIKGLSDDMLHVVVQYKKGPRIVDPVDKWIDITWIAAIYK